jgi:hemolysin III
MVGMTVTTTPARLRPQDVGKPRLRGWLHTYAFFAAAAAALLLAGVAATRPGLTPLVSVAVYGVTICGLFGVSALYHRRVWTPRGYQVMRRLDHAMIFIFIAGTYTPFCLLLLRPASATVILAVVWGGALVGAAVKLAWPHAPRLVSAPLYVALGWVAVAVLPQILHRGGVVALVLLLAGGVSYSVGAVCYALRRPNPWPGVFGHHEVFHAATLVAAICHQVAIYFALYA